MSALDLDALEAKAREATPGPWRTTWGECCFGVTISTEVPPRGHVNDAFIAACDPTTVLALITRLRAAEARTAWNYDMSAAPHTWVLACEGEIVYKAAPCGDEWVEVGGRTIKPRCWQPLPAAPEAP